MQRRREKTPMFTAFVTYMASFVIIPVFMESLYLARLSVSSQAQLAAHPEPSFEELYS